MKLLAFDVGGTEIKYGVVEDGINITHKGSIPTPTDCMDSFLNAVDEIWQKHKDVAEGIAMSLPGTLDIENGCCARCGAMKYPHDREIGRLIKERCNCTVVLENDGKAAASAELYYGSLKGCVNAAVFLLGTGTGGGLIIDGKPVRGRHNSAGEFSFIATEASSYQNPDNIAGSKCSTSFLLKTYCKRKGIEPINGYEFFERLPDDDTAKEVLNELCLNVALQIYNMNLLLDLDRVAIGGGISKQPVVTEKIREKYEEVKKNSFTGRIHYPTDTEIVTCSFHNDANLIGSYIAYDEYKDRINY